MVKKGNTKSFIESVARTSFDEKVRVECKKHKITSHAYTNYNVNLNGELAIIFSGYVKADKGYEYYCKPNFPFYRIVYTLSGQAKLKYPDKTYNMKSGTICVFPPKDRGVISSQGDVPWEHYYLHFTGKHAAKIFRQAKFNLRKTVDTSNPPQIVECLDNILDEQKNNLEISSDINNHYLRILFLRLSHDFNNGGDDHSLASRETYLACRNYINAHFSEITDFQRLADACNISKVYFCRIFKQYANTSPMVYVMNLKLNKAAVLFMQTDYSVKQISQILHFQDQCYFSKLFKKKYGIPPKLYRKKYN